jgi:hypothetical protein
VLTHEVLTHEVPASGLARPQFGVNHVIAYGQSLSSGWEGTPALSRMPRLDCLMLGASVRPASEHAAEWRPVGEAELQPLVATVQAVDGGETLTADAVAALPPDSVLLGETVLESALHHWRCVMTTSDASHLLAASSCGVGGRSLEQLSRGAEPELFNRLRDCARLTRAAAEALGRGYGIVALLLLHGENNNWGLDGATADRAAYKALMAALCRDMRDELATGIAGQDLSPAIFTYQTGGAYAADHMAIPMAQWEASQEVAGLFLAAPAYPVTDKGGHLDANGYRWLGAQFGKAMHVVLDLGQDWRPLSPRRAMLAGTTVSVSFDVPVAPLAFGRPYGGHLAWDVANQGFAVIDDDGAVPIAAVELDGARGVTIELVRPPRGDCVLRYADSTHHGGLGGLHDSDMTPCLDRYSYLPGIGHHPGADIAALVGKPYPLMNWCVAFAIPVGIAD